MTRWYNRNDRFHHNDNLTDSRKSLKTTDRQEAELLVQHKKQASKNAHINRKIGMAYLSTADPTLATRVWRDVMEDSSVARGERNKRTRTCCAAWSL
jgi:hypothetical protein